MFFTSLICVQVWIRKILARLLQSFATEIKCNIERESAEHLARDHGQVPAAQSHMEDEDLWLDRGQFLRRRQENSGVTHPPAVAGFKSGGLQVQADDPDCQISISGPGRLAVHSIFRVLTTQ